MSDIEAKIKVLVDNFSAQESSITSSTSPYGETELRCDFIDPLFEALGWDMGNASGLPRSIREVIREDSVDVENRVKKPDYSMRVAGQRKFFVEAKKPAVDIQRSRDAAFQVRRYGWSANLSISLLTNFKHLRIYDTTFPPSPTDDADAALIFEFHYTDYVRRSDEIAALLSRARVSSEAFYENFSDARGRGIQVNDVFLEKINEWRMSLARDLLLRYPLDDGELNDVVQKIINRVIFIRMCEDRGIENENVLRAFADRRDFVEIQRLFRRMDERYNTGLFDVDDDPFQRDYQLETELFLSIVDDVYLPRAPYTFSVLDSDFLGQVYEVFLTQRLSVDDGVLSLKDKPVYEDREIVTTPQVIVDELSKRTLHGCFSQKRGGGASLPFDEMRGLRVLDIAVGSSRFLLKAFDLLVEEAVRYYQAVGHHGEIFQRSVGDWQLCFTKKKEILTNCLFGIDIDYSAVEVARFSLIVRLLEDENANTLPTGRKILPNLNANVIWGNSIVDERFVREDDEKTLPLRWSDAFNFENFDIIVGNPPYMKTEEMKGKFPEEFAFYKKYYTTPYRQFDKYFVFLERAIQKVKPDGWIGMIIPNKWITIESGEKVRKLLSTAGLVSEIVDFGSEQIFRGKSIYCCLLILNRSAREEIDYQYVQRFHEWSVDPVIRKLRLPATLLQEYGASAWVLPSNELETNILKGLFSNSMKLGEVCDVFNGIQTSAEKIFAIDNWTERRGGLIRFEKDGQEWIIEKGITKPYLTDENLVGSFLILKYDCLVIFPYHFNGRGEAVPYNRRELSERFPLAYRYLEAHRARLLRRDVQPKPPESEFYRYGRHQSLAVAFSAPKIVACVNQRGDKYALDQNGIGIASGGTAGEIGISNPKHGYSIYFILGLLNFKGVEYYCRKRGSPFRGGWFARGTAAIWDVPVPIVNLEQPSPRKELHDEIVVEVRRIIALLGEAEGQGFSGRRMELHKRNLSSAKRKIDRNFSILYGLEGFIDELTLD